MRLVAEFDKEKEAYDLYRFLLKEGIQNVYESFLDPLTKQKKYRVWVEEEDAFSLAQEHLEHFRAHPDDIKYQGADEGPPRPPSSSPPPPSVLPKDLPPEKKWTIHVSFKPRFSSRVPLTHFLMALCIFIFLWNEMEEMSIFKTKGPLAVVLGLTPIEKQLLFDYPKSFGMIDQFVNECPLESVKEIKELSAAQQAYLQEAERAPSWRGIYGLLFDAKEENGGPLFEKIKEGEVWRLFTPCLLHRDLLHILFNMAWLWVLGRQIEERLKKLKVIFFILIVGIISNVAQYLMSGPYFIGFSGVVVGMVGFIWMRQRLAPWEGYPLQRPTILFIFFFILAIVALEVFSLLFQIFAHVTLPVSIANTAHIVGGLAGIALGRIPFFAREAS